jgi:secreted trypsin-like serine protease
MNLHQKLSAGFALATCLGLSAIAQAGTIRHDTNDALYQSAGSQFQNVGALQVVTTGGTFGCSATLLAPGDWVLTAGHCTDGATAGGTTFSLGDTIGTSGGSFFVAATTFDVAEIVPHNKWDGSLSKGYDIALMRLVQNATDASGVAGANIYTGTGEVGSVGTPVGFGVTGNGITGTTFLTGDKRAGNNTIDGFFRTPGKTPRVFGMDFDNPNGSTNVFGSSASRNLELLIAFGDSGGPVFIGSEVAGVNSFIVDYNSDGLYANYEDYSGHTRVSAFADWIDGVLAGQGGSDDDSGGGGPPSGRGGGRFSFASAIATPLSIPEPSSLVLLLVGAVMTLARSRRI